MYAAYLPHPFLIASGLLFAFGWWAFNSERKRVKTPHPKTLHPLRLALEGTLLAALVSGAYIAACVYGAQPLDRENITIATIFGLSLGGAYVMCPYMGYNLFWNVRIFSGPAPFFALALALAFLSMGIEAQFGP